MSKKKRKMRGTVQKVIEPAVPGEPEKAQINIEEAEDLYREIRVENVGSDEKGDKASLKEGAEVDALWKQIQMLRQRNLRNPEMAEEANRWDMAIRGQLGSVLAALRAIAAWDVDYQGRGRHDEIDRAAWKARGDGIIEEISDEVDILLFAASVGARGSVV